VIGALHLPPFPGSNHPDQRSLSEIRDYALRNVEKAVKAGVSGVYLQDLGDHPVAPQIQAYSVAGMSAVGAAVRAAFPGLYLGVA
jgi:predicted TIM-barrel enzyme